MAAFLVIAVLAATLAPIGWTSPLAGPPVVTRAFDPPPLPWLPGHRGVDLAGDAGQPVLAAGAGVVAFAGLVAGRGVVSVEHAGGLRTTYEPVTSTVDTGDTVGLGQQLGTLGLAARVDLPRPDAVAAAVAGAPEAAHSARASARASRA
jgi:murein DD-endopeptidase MepM/ murein hydrolase activator NlpD